MTMDLSKSILPALFIILALLESVNLAPMKKRKPNLEQLKNLLGADFETFSKLEGDVKLEFIKKLTSAKPEDRDKVYKFWKEITKRHVPGHSPGSVEQLHETWRADDHMGDDSYSPDVLFRSHDFNNDGILTGPEIRSLYYSQLDRMYPDHEDLEEKLRQREDIRMYANYLNLMDTNRDGKISIDEFRAYHPQHDEEYDWMDEDDMPDPDHLADDQILVDAVRKDLEIHPNDTISEELMHRIAGKPAIPEKPNVPSFPGYLGVHDHDKHDPNLKHKDAHQAAPEHNDPHGAQPVPVAAHVPEQEHPQTPKPHT